MVISTTFICINSDIRFNSIPVFNKISLRFTRLFNRWQFHYLYIILNSQYSFSNVSYYTLDFFPFMEKILFFDSFSPKSSLKRKLRNFRLHNFSLTRSTFLFNPRKILQRLFGYQPSINPVLFISDNVNSKFDRRFFNSSFFFKNYMTFYFSSLFRTACAVNYDLVISNLFNSLIHRHVLSNCSLLYYRFFLCSSYYLYFMHYLRFCYCILLFLFFQSLFRFVFLSRLLKKLKRIKGFLALFILKFLALLSVSRTSRLPRFFFNLIQFFKVRSLKLIFLNFKRLSIRALRSRKVVLKSRKLLLNVFFDHWLFNRLRTFLIKKGLGLRSELVLLRFFRSLKVVSNLDPYVIFSNILFKILLPIESRQTKIFGKVHLVPYRIRMRRQLFIAFKLLFTNVALGRMPFMLSRFIDCLYGRGELFSTFNKNVKSILENRHLAISFMRRRERSKMRFVSSFKYSIPKRNKYSSMFSRFYKSRL